MNDFESLAHVRWECKYHIVFIPKYRRKVIYGKLRNGIGRILRDLCEQKNIELLEGHAMSDHVHIMFEHTAKIQRVVYSRISEREECGEDSSGTAE
jgi:putative transposase